MALKRVIFILAAICAAAAVLYSILQPLSMIAPGRPIAAHADIADDCFACHTPFVGSSADKCIECHKPSDIGITATTGRPIASDRKRIPFHQHLREADCTACHSDHEGVTPFRPASRFAHSLLEPGTRRNCGDCHAKPADTLHRQVDAQCGQCHRTRGWLPATFDHDRYFRFDRHHPAECATCHSDGDYSRYTCYSCHEHSPAKIRREHLEEGIRDFEQCSDCHRSGDEDEAERHWKSMQRRDGNAPRIDDD